MHILYALGDSRYVRMDLFVQTGAPLLDHEAFNDSVFVKRLGRTKYSPTKRMGLILA